MPPFPHFFRSVRLVALSWSVFAAAAVAVQAATIDGVRARNQLVCGISEDVAGLATFASPDTWRGLEVDFCRAVAAAVLGDGSRVRLRPANGADGFRALAAGEIDLLAGGSAWSLSRDTEFKVRFVDILLHDGQGFMVPRTHGLSSALELSGASICVVAGTRVADMVAGYMARQRMRYRFVTSARWNEIVASYANGNCTALAGDMTQLAAARAGLANPAEHALLPELIGKEPLGPAVRLGDDAWFAIVRWVLMALVAAEELGVTQDNAEASRASPYEEVRRLLGVGNDLGQSLGVSADWAFRAIRQSGNYGEMFDRNLGLGSALRLPRAHNRLWTQGGLMYAVPIR